jgi:hypothetical protein
MNESIVATGCEPKLLNSSKTKIANNTAACGKHHSVADFMVLH